MELTLFDFMEETKEIPETKKDTPVIEEETSIPIRFGQMVQIKNADKSVIDSDPESYFYLKEFEGKKGEVIEIGLQFKPVGYFVRFKNGEVGVFNACDFAS